MDPNTGRIFDLNDPNLTDDVRERLLDIRTPTPAYWNGLETTALRGTAIVADDGKFPEYWARKEGIIGERIDVVRIDLNGVNFGGGIAYMDNRDGSAWRKVTDGHGSPSYGHRDVQIVEDSFRTAIEDVERVREANLEVYKTEMFILENRKKAALKELVDTETEELGEILEEYEKIKTMSDGPPEQFYETNRAARRKQERRDRALKKRKPNGR